MDNQIKIGFDLDGVLAQHALGGFWFKLRKLKEKLLKKTHSSSYYFPKTFIEKIGWMAIDWFRRSLNEKDLLCSLAKKKNFKLYLITGRFKFLERLTIEWLKKNKLFTCFEKVFVNAQDLEPTGFKAKKINQLGLDFYIDDDLDTISDLRKKTSIEIIDAQNLNKFLKDCSAGVCPKKSF